VGNIHFYHRITPEQGACRIVHGVRLEKGSYDLGDMELLKSLFADVPTGLMQLKREVEG
jgi:hypothetical protein